MKKTYIKPSLEIYAIQTEGLVATTPVQTTVTIQNLEVTGEARSQGFFGSPLDDNTEAEPSNDSWY